jgi:hypothetical protein
MILRSQAEPMSQFTGQFTRGRRCVYEAVLRPCPIATGLLDSNGSNDGAFSKWIRESH